MKIKIICSLMSSLCLSSFSSLTHAEDYYNHHTVYNRYPAYQHEHRHHHSKTLRWLDSAPHAPIPIEAVIGGHQSQFPGTLYICRGEYHGGLHPGKLVHQRCNISWGGKEIRLSQYQILVSRIRLSWLPASHGYIPPNAILGGDEHDQPLYICQAAYRNGVHPGKIVGQACNIGWGGKEVAIPNYNVLVR